MPKDPAFLFYSDNFQSGTQFFTDEQTGKYIRLMCAQHQHGHLSEKQMLHICKTYDEDIFAKFIKDERGFYYNERLEIEIVKRRAYSESRAKNRKKTSFSYEGHMENGNGNGINNLNTEENAKPKKFINYRTQGDDLYAARLKRGEDQKNANRS